MLWTQAAYGKSSKAAVSIAENQHIGKPIADFYMLKETVPVKEVENRLKAHGRGKSFSKKGSGKGGGEGFGKGKGFGKKGGGK